MSWLQAKLAAARAAGALSRIAGRGGGTSLPGKLLLVLQPDAIAALSGRIAGGSAVISATNGKTTSAAITASILTGAGHRLVHNREGANMAGGVATTLLAASRPHARIDGDLGLFEVDELWLEPLVGELSPRAVALGNLFRDQLDRYGELETIADRWAQVAAQLPPACTLVLNADDPLVADLGRERTGVTYFGIEDAGVALPEMQHAADSKHCRRCGTPYRYETIYVGHLGDYACPQCGQRRPQPTVCAREIRLRGTDAAELTLVTPAGSRRVSLPLPGLYNVYNALAAASLGLALGADLEQVATGLESVAAAFGRAETVAVGDRELRLLLVKNPVGANEVLRTLALEDAEQLDLLCILNDLIADGRDVSWIWDADFELLADRVRSATCAGTRAAELALRLKYAGVPSERLSVVPELGPAVDQALAAAPGRRVYALPTYTALLGLRELLSSRGHVERYWQAGR